MRVLATGSGMSSQNIYTGVELYLNGTTASYTVSGDKNISIRAVVSDLPSATTGKTMTLTIYSDYGGEAQGFYEQATATCAETTDTTGFYEFATPPFPYPDGSVLTARLTSDNSSDVVVSVQAWVLDADDDLALVATGLDRITATAPSALATTWPGKLLQLWSRFFGKATKTSTQLKTYVGSTTTVITTQTISDDGTTQTQGLAS